ncbi:MAG: Kdo hydroxylase family protein [Acidobacteriales bacterium]|nr:Kdo hydroxylase family protein [Terriglobales bacterium]
MPLVTIESPGSLSPNEKRALCEQLELGSILFFPRSPIDVPQDDLDFLLRQQQVESGFHKNIAYRPLENRISGADSTSPQDSAHLQCIMQGYSRAVIAFLTDFLAPYRAQWNLDYASFRPQAEESRHLAMRKRNDLLHTDAFPTRPTHGDRILRFFNNINPREPRRWITGGTFQQLAPRYAGKNGVPLPRSASSTLNRSIAKFPVVRKLAPQLARSPYDAFMMDFHNFLKENSEYQANCAKEQIDFPPGSSWMVYTDTVSHAVLSGSYALEQTLLVHHDAMVRPEDSPLGVLQSISGAPLS